MKVKEYMVKLAEEIAANNKYGYSNDWPNNRFFIDSTPYDGDCGAFCSAVLNKALEQIGIKETRYYEPQGGWDIYNEEYLLKYCNRYKYSDVRNQAADILINGGHTVMVTAVDPDYICHAANDYDGKSGDSSGNEIRRQKLYDGGWHYLYRLKDEYNKEIKDKTPEDVYKEIKIRVLKKGMSGDDVKCLQALLNLWTTQSGENPPIAVDGYFGDETEERTKLYQTLQGLYVDGVAGQFTWTDILSK